MHRFVFTTTAITVTLTNDEMYTKLAPSGTRSIYFHGAKAVFVLKM